MEYRVLLSSVDIADKKYYLNDIVEHFDGYPWGQAIANKAIEIVDGSKSEPKKEEPKKIETVNSKEVTVTKAGPWFKVLDANGELVGKATRDEEEANRIAEDYKNS